MNAVFTWITALVRSLLRLEPTQHARWEHIIFRVALAYLVMISVPYMDIDWRNGHFIMGREFPQYTTLPAPSSIGAVFPGITALSDPAVFTVVRTCFWIALGLYAFGIAVPVVITYIFVVDMCLGSLDASQGAHGHSRQVLGLVLLGIAMASWVGVFMKARGGWRNLLVWTQPAQDLCMNWGRQMLAAAYAVSAVTKEINSDGLWFAKSESFILAVMKAQEEAQIKGVAITDEAKEMAVWMAQNPLMSSGMLLGAWILEMSAPLMLLNRRIALWLGILLCIFHVINGWFMGLPFPLNRLLIIVLFVNIPFWAVWATKKLAGGQPGMLPAQG
jgi:hypothetical protein